MQPDTVAIDAEGMLTLRSRLAGRHDRVALAEIAGPAGRDKVADVMRPDVTPRYAVIHVKLDVWRSAATVLASEAVPAENLEAQASRD